MSRAEIGKECFVFLSALTFNLSYLAYSPKGVFSLISQIGSLHDKKLCMYGCVSVPIFSFHAFGWTR